MTVITLAGNQARCASASVQRINGGRTSGLRLNPIPLSTNHGILVAARACGTHVAAAGIGKDGFGALSEPCRSTPPLIIDSHSSADRPEHHIISFPSIMAELKAQIAIASRTAVILTRMLIWRTTIMTPRNVHAHLVDYLG